MRYRRVSGHRLRLARRKVSHNVVPAVAIAPASSAKTVSGTVSVDMKDGHAHGLDQVVDRTGRYALDVSVLNHRRQGLPGHAARLKESEEIAALAQFGDTQLHCPGTVGDRFGFANGAYLPDFSGPTGNLNYLGAEFRTGALPDAR